MKIEKLCPDTIDFIIENILLEEIQINKLKELKNSIKSIKAEKEKVDTLEKLVNYQKGKTVDYGDMPHELINRRDCLYDYEKGVDTYIDNQLEKFSENLDEEEIKMVWDDLKNQYKYDILEKVIEEKYPGVVKYLIENKITVIRFYW